jgi:hypothetical protein
MYSESSIAADAAARETLRFSHLSAVPVVAGVECLEVVYLRRTAVMR